MPLLAMSQSDATSLKPFFQPMREDLPAEAVIFWANLWVRITA